MEVLKQRWQIAAMHIEAFSFRERLLVFLASAGVLVSLLFLGVIEPALKRQEQAIDAHDEVQREMQSMGMQLAARAEQQIDRKAQELKALRHETTALERGLRSGAMGMIPPDRMVETLKSLLDAQTGLKLIALGTLPPEPLFKAATEPQTDSSPPLIASSVAQFYRHGLEMRVQGSYAGLLRYVEALERLPWSIQWHVVALNGQSYPEVVMALRLSTLSEVTQWANM